MTATGETKYKGESKDRIVKAINKCLKAVDGMAYNEALDVLTNAFESLLHELDSEEARHAVLRGLNAFVVIQLLGHDGYQQAIKEAEAITERTMEEVEPLIAKTRKNQLH